MLIFQSFLSAQFPIRIYTHGSKLDTRLRGDEAKSRKQSFQARQAQQDQP